MNSEKGTSIHSTLLVGKSAQQGYPWTIVPKETEGVEREPVIVLALDSCGSSAWGANDFLILDCYGDIASTLTVEALFFSKGQPVFTMKNNMLGGRRLKCCFWLKYLDSSRRYPQKLKGHLKCVTAGPPTDIADVDRVELRVHSGIDFRSFSLYDVSVRPELPDLSVSGEPMVDAFGQYTDREWEGKIHSEEELRTFLLAEYEWAKTHDCYPDDAFDRFGGYKDLHFGKKDRFYKHFDGERWWLVDPDGNAFFSNGICYGSRMGVFGFADAFEELYSWLPETDDPKFASAWTTADNIVEFVKRNGLEVARGKKLFNFARANMIRVFGDDWKEAWLTINRARLKQWGFNTISVCVNNYQDEDVVWYLRNAKMPYCYTLKDFPKTDLCLYRDFPDVFSKEYEGLCRKFADQLRPFADDPFLMGYFVTNEPEWMFQKTVNPAERAFACETLSDTKRHLIRLLQEKYSTIDALNQAWNTAYSSFADLEAPIANIDRFSDVSKADMLWLRDVMIDQFAAVPARILRQLAPAALNLGMRYSAVAKEDFCGSDWFDAFSFNCYRADPDGIFHMASHALDIPFVVGEWHIGGVEGGLTSGGIINATTQAERGKGCAQYMRSAFLCKSCVGAHYFELNDHPLLGRFDGENKQIGLIDVCNRPYYDCVDRFAQMNKNVYRILTGEFIPDKESWQERCRF